MYKDYSKKIDQLIEKYFLIVRIGKKNISLFEKDIKNKYTPYQYLADSENADYVCTDILKNIRFIRQSLDIIDERNFSSKEWKIFSNEITPLFTRHNGTIAINPFFKPKINSKKIERDTEIRKKQLSDPKAKYSIFSDSISHIGWQNITTSTLSIADMERTYRSLTINNE